MPIESEVSGLVQAKQEVEGLTRQLQENRERLELVQQAANIGIFEWNIPAETIAWTKEAEALYGLAPGSFGGNFAAWERSVHPDDLPEARNKVLESIANGTNLDVQFRVIWPADGSIHWIYAKARTFYSPKGKPLRMVGINIDITERMDYEEELRIRDERIRLFVESGIIGLIFAEMDGAISYANDAFLQMTGYSRDDLDNGKVRWNDMTPPEWRELDQQKIAETKRNGAPILYEKQYIHKNGSRIDIFIGYLFIGERREQAVAFVLDVTRRKRLERQKDEFIGIVSHELRTPVTSLKVFAQLLEKRFSKSGDHQNAELLMKMGTQINKLARLIEDLIDVTKLETGKLQLHEVEFDLASLINEVAEEMQRTTTHHTIRKEDLEPTIIRGDRDRIGQVLTNLLSNAIKYSPQADSILIKTFLDDKQVTVSVVDAGMGIPLEKQKLVFQRFYRVDEKNLETISGMGLGLYISAEMIKRQGGNMWFVSTPGHGSTFSFSLPLAGETTEALKE